MKTLFDWSKLGSWEPQLKLCILRLCDRTMKRTIKKWNIDSNFWTQVTLKSWKTVCFHIKLFENKRFNIDTDPLRPTIIETTFQNNNKHINTRKILKNRLYFMETNGLSVLNNISCFLGCLNNCNQAFLEEAYKSFLQKLRRKLWKTDAKLPQKIKNGSQEPIIYLYKIFFRCKKHFGINCAKLLIFITAAWY